MENILYTSLFTKDGSNFNIAKYIKLEIWDKAQHEAARRPRYDFREL